MNLSEHFTLEEATFSSTAQRLGLDNTPGKTTLVWMQAAAKRLEDVRTLLGRPLHIDSWYRCPELNLAVGGAANSAHMAGYAIDFISPPDSPEAIVQAIAISPIAFDQLIQEGTWVHISFAPALRRQVLTAHFGPGGTTYTKGA